MSTKTTFWIVILISLLAFAVSGLLIGLMPDRMATHWNASGQADGYSSPAAGAFIIPGMTLGLGLLLLFIPRVDPLRKNIEAFRADYNGFIIVFAIFMVYIHVLSLLWNLGIRFNMSQMMMPAMGIFIYYVGILMGKAQRNYFIGIRTPWTLASDTVWKKTHQRGSLVYKGAGILTLVGILLPDLAVGFILIPILLGSLYLVVYSYVLFRRESAQTGGQL